MFARSTNTGRVITYVHNGANYASHFQTPLITLHNNLAGLNLGDYQHLSAAQKTVATQAATASLDGYATSTQITKLDGIATAATANAKATPTEVRTGTDDTKFTTALGVNYALKSYQPKVNLIGEPGQLGYGVGICPAANLPTGMTGMAGYDVYGGDNWGNYQFTDGSIMCYIPKFYYRIASASNPTYGVHGVNSIDIKGIDTFASTAAANTGGYALHRAFTDGGAEKAGFFFDKYKCSKIANGAGYTAGSVKDGLPLSSAATHNPFSGLTGGADYYYSAIDLAHRRDGVDGAVNASSIFHCRSQFQGSALAMLSMAHGQAATSTTNCAWYHATYNYPKGCNNNALSDTNDVYNAGSNPTGPLWVTDGYDTCGKTGSASPFAKSTHNGQTCGVADLNGLIYEISIGLTSIVTSPAIGGMTRANPCEITVTAHGKSTGDYVQITSITQADWSGCKDKIWTLNKTGDNTFTIPFDSSGFGTAYDAGTDVGTVTISKFYVAKEATAMKTFTNGTAAATDHWGATGVAAMMDEFVPAFYTTGGGVFAKYFGSGSNQVLSEAISGANRLLTGLGLPKDASGFDGTGSDLFGKDHYYQYIVNDMCMRACSHWYPATNAGVWSVDWAYRRTSSHSYVGFRAACYPV
jgi:hypothetical protein